MTLKTLLIGAGAVALVAGGGAVAATTTTEANPLLDRWIGPFGGVPPWDKVKVEHLQPGLEAAIAEQLADAERIANDPSPPTFENTIAAMERAGRTLDRASTIFGVYASTLNDDAVQAVERTMSPKFAELGDRIVQNEKLFQRVAAVYDTRETSGLTAEQQRLTWVHYTNFVRAGARLDAKSKERLSAINQRLATLFTSFGQNVLADEQNGLVLIDSEARLAGLSPGLRTAAASAAESRGQKGKWAVLNTRSSVEPFLTYAEDRALREQVWRMFVDRGDSGGATDNNKLITEILQLRAERAKLLGYETHAHWRLENAMAKNPQRAMELMEAVWTPAVARVREEVADMQAVADAEKAGIAIEPWDYRFYAEKVRKAKYDLDESRDHALHAAREPARGHVLHGEAAVRHELPAGHRRQRPGLPPGRARLGGHRRHRQAHRALVLRSLRAHRQALGRVDERLPQPGALRWRGHDDRLEQLQLREGRARQAGADQLGGRPHAVPRVRPRAARAAARTSAIRRSAARRSRATTSSFPRSCSSTGCRRRRS